MAFRLMTALSREKNKVKGTGFLYLFLNYVFFWVLAGTSVRHLCRMFLSRDLFIPSLLGCWGCMVRGVHTSPCTCTWAAPLEAWPRQRLCEQDDCCPPVHHRLHGELGLLPSHPTATHGGWLCHMLLARTYIIL